MIVDIRKSPPTYGQWEVYILNEYNHHQLLVTKGFAHGFVTITPNCNVQYKVYEYCSKEHDDGIAFDDSVLSQKDTQHPTLAELDNPFVYGEI